MHQNPKFIKYLESYKENPDKFKNKQENHKNILKC